MAKVVASAVKASLQQSSSSKSIPSLSSRSGSCSIGTVNRMHSVFSTDQESSGVVVGKKRYQPPSAFCSSSINNLRGNKHGKRLQHTNKMFIRDIVCLPASYGKTQKNNIPIPRGRSRSDLAQKGLIGKIEFNTGMTEMDIRREICEVFAIPFGYNVDDWESPLFPFTLLQTSGAGCKTLSEPATSRSFRWSAEQIISLCGKGTLYILAGNKLQSSKMVRPCL